MPHSNCFVCLPPTTSFSATPIGTLDALARMLKHSVEELQDIARTADQRYRVVRVPKDGGGFRECFDALGLLKSIHGRLLHMILERVNYPLYLQGSIKDRTSPRGQKANAEQHISPETLITVDIKSFFPSVKRPIIFDIWHRFFRFPPCVADILQRSPQETDACHRGPRPARCSPIWSFGISNRRFCLIFTNEDQVYPADR